MVLAAAVAVVGIRAAEPTVSNGGVQLWEGGPYWSGRNIGADNPWDYGLYFWWGDTTGYRPSADGRFGFKFRWDNPDIYTYHKTVSELQSADWVTSSGALAPSHDAAHVKWGGNWRMPTEAEFSALKDNCVWAWTTMNGVYGYIVRGRGAYESNSIFLPAAGYGDGTFLYAAGTYGEYWSSVPCSNSGMDVYELHISSDYHIIEYYSPCYGYPIRAVFDEVAPAQTYIVRLHRNNSERDGSTAGRTYTIGKARALPKIQKELKWAPRKGYDFLGWAKTANATTAQYTDGQSLKDLTKTAGATVHLYAVWKAHKYIVRLHRNNSKNDGATTGRAFDYDQVRFLPTMAELKWVRSGYMFLGWSQAQSSSTVKYADGLNVFNLSPNDGEELHIWGVWKKAEANAYLLRLHRNNSERDGATAGRQLKLNTNRKLPTVKELGWSRTDATFKGWATTAKNAAAGKVTYNDGATVKNLVKTAGDTAHLYAVWR